MTKRLLTGVLASFLIFGAIIPTGTFADETIPQDDNQAKKEYKNPFEKTDKTPEEKAELRFEIVETYAFDQVDTYAALVEEHESIHESITALQNETKALRKAYQESLKEEVKAYIDDLKTQIEADEITREEAKDLFDLYAENKKVERENKGVERAELEALKTELEANKVDREEIRIELKSAIDAEDTETAYNLVVEWIELGKVHIDIDEQKLEIYDDILNNLSAE